MNSKRRKRRSRTVGCRLECERTDERRAAGCINHLRSRFARTGSLVSRSRPLCPFPPFAILLCFVLSFSILLSPFQSHRYICIDIELRSTERLERVGVRSGAQGKINSSPACCCRRDATLPREVVSLLFLPLLSLDLPLFHPFHKCTSPELDFSLSNQTYDVTRMLTLKGLSNF